MKGSARVFYLGVSVGSSFPHAFGGESAALTAAKIGVDPRLKTFGVTVSTLIKRALMLVKKE